MTAADAVVSVDLGKTSCRVSLSVDGRETAAVAGTGLPGLASPDGVADTAATIAALAERLVPGSTPGAVGVGAAGALTAPDAAERLARILADRFMAPVAVASDIVTAHVGAFDGEAGVCLVVGTGAVALGVSPDARVSRRDGLGLVAGDLGSGAWIGRAGLRVAELAQAGAAAPTRLADLIPDAAAVALSIAADPAAASALARYAPVVLEAASEGDPAAVGIVDAAASELAATTLAAALDTGQRTVAVLGGVSDSDRFQRELHTALSDRDLIVRAPTGTALDGARLIAARHDLPLEGFIHRARY